MTCRKAANRRGPESTCCPTAASRWRPSTTTRGWRSGMINAHHRADRRGPALRGRHAPAALGQSGPIASSLGGFLRYQTESAWTWEHMALTRARVVAGDRPASPSSESRAAIRAIVCPPARSREARRPTWPTCAGASPSSSAATGLWDMKHRRGGLIDIEFIAAISAAPPWRRRMPDARCCPARWRRSGRCAGGRLHPAGRSARHAAQAHIAALAQAGGLISG